MLAEMETHPEVMRRNIEVYTDDISKMYNLFKEAIEKLPREKNQIFLIGRLNGKIVGFLGIHYGSKHKAHVGNVGITVHPDYWNTGFGTQLLKAGVAKAQEEGLMKLEAETLFSNKAMIRIAEKVGFKVESVRKKLIKKSGKREDIALLSMLLK